jgi:UDP-GlcNAc:undecaprenyl-phosphate GlcNAc-1-phosphate transferase
VTNAWNMLDGVDGLALSQFLIATLALALWRGAHAPVPQPDALTVAIVAACAPIFAANLGLLGARMKCFLGDAGARFLGFFLAHALIVEGGRALSPIDAAYLVALPLLDMGAVVIERLRAGQGSMRPDRRHLHHLLLDSIGSARLTVATMAAVSLSFFGLLWALTAADAGDPVEALIFLTLAAAYWRWRRSLVAILARLATSRAALQTTPPAE